MTDEEISELARLIQEYDAKQGEGTGDEISGALMFSHEVADQIKVFKRARGRKIILEPDPGAVDGVIISYRVAKVKRNSGK